MIVQAEVSQNANRESWTVVVNLCIPLLPILWIDVAVVLQLYVLNMKSKEEAIVESPLVDIWAVLYFPLLCCQAQGENKHDDGGNAPQCVPLHHNNNESVWDFIAQIIVFGD